MTTLAVRVPDSALRELDALVAAGRYENRTAAVRAALEQLMAAERRREIDAALVEGYRLHPATPPNELTESLADRSVMEEPW